MLCSRNNIRHLTNHLKERGSVILFVLGLILLTSLLLTRFIARAHTELLTEARQSQLEPLRDEAYSALQVTLAVLADFQAIDSGLHAPSEGWGEPLLHADYTPPAGFQTEVKVLDESGKISLAKIDPNALHNLLLTLDFLPSDADRIVDSILAWTQAEYPAQYRESSATQSQASIPDLNPPLKALRSFTELKLIPVVRQLLCDESGDWNEAGERLLSNVNLFANNQVNLNTAGTDVLNALGLDTESIIAGRNRADGRSPQIFTSLSDVGSFGRQNSGSTLVGVDAVLLRIQVVAKFGGRKFLLVADVQRGSGSTQSTPAINTDEPTSDPRPWTRNRIDSGFRILEIRENNGF